MQQKEFEELTGLQIAPDEYYEIEQIYNTVDTIDKKEFCEHWKRGNYMYIFSQLVKKIRNYEKWAVSERETKEICTPVLLDKANVYNDYKLKEVAISLAGIRETVRLSITHDYKLCADEKNYLRTLLDATELPPRIDEAKD